MVHLVILIFGLLLALSLCGAVGTILWLVVRRGHALTARDLIPLVGFTLSSLVSLTLFTISATSANAPQKKPTTGLEPHGHVGSPTPTPSATPRASATATATPRASATATPRPTPTATPHPSPSATPHPSPTATPSPTPTVAAHPSATATPSPVPPAKP